MLLTLKTNTEEYSSSNGNQSDRLQVVHINVTFYVAFLCHFLRNQFAFVLASWSF